MAIQRVGTVAIDLRTVKWKEPTGPFPHGSINRQLSVISRPSRFSLDTLGTPGQSLSTTQVGQVAVDRSAPDQLHCPAVARR